MVMMDRYKDFESFNTKVLSSFTKGVRVPRKVQNSNNKRGFKAFMFNFEDNKRLSYLENPKQPQMLKLRSHTPSIATPNK